MYLSNNDIHFKDLYYINYYDIYVCMINVYFENRVEE